MEAQNQILLDDKVGGKGKFFTTRFLQAGLVKYSFGVCLLDKETIDRFIYNFVGCPVIINHKDVTNTSAKDDRVGVISRVWFNEQDGWYWGEGVIFEQEALDLIDKGYNVSCQYEITEYSSTGGIHNGNEYDKTILNGKPEHLAIVKNPRYENAMIAVNAMDLDAINDDGYWFSTEKGSHIHVKKGESKKEALEERFEDFEEAPKELKEEDSEDYKDLEKQRDGLMQQVQGLKKRLESATTKDAKEAIQRGIDARKERIGKLEDAMIKEKKKASNEENKKEKPLTYINKDDKTIPIFNNHFSKKTGLYKYDKVIDDKKSAERNKIFPKLVFMTPDKYIEKCVQGFNEEFIRNNQKTITKKELEDDRYSDKSSMEYLNNNFNNNNKFDLPFIEYYTRETGEIQFANQEGLHRAIVARDNNISKIPVMIFSSNYYGENINNDLLKENLEYICSEFKDKAKNDIIMAINEIKGLDMFKNLFKKKEKNMDREEIKEIMMECLTELTASNEAEKKDEPDYKKMYEDLKAECEAKAKNEEKEEDIEEEKEEVVENKCDKAKAKNEIEAQKEAMMSEVITTKSTYITQSKARELGKELF